MLPKSPLLVYLVISRRAPRIRQIWSTWTRFYRLKGGQTLPEGAHVVSVKPATNFARVFPGGWGYVIAFTATDSSIRAYVTERTGNPGELIERYPAALKN